MNHSRTTSRTRWALFAFVLALAAGSGLGTLSAEETGYSLKASAMPSTTGTTQNWWCETSCPKDQQGVKCCYIRANSTGDEEASSGNDTAN